MTVSALADAVGITGDAVRYYERIGLLPEPERSPAGYRLYDDGAVERLRFVKRAQRFGLKLDEIGELIDILERGMCPCGHTRELLQRRLVTLDEEMAALSALRHDIEGMLDDLPPAGETGWTCGPGLLQIGTDRGGHERRKGRKEG